MMTGKERGKHTEFEMKLRRAIAENLRRLLKEHNMTQRELSEKAGLPTSTISDYVNGKSLALPGNVEKLAAALGVSKDEIDPSFSDDIDVPGMYDPRIRFFEELERELGIDLTDPDIQKMIKKAAKLLFSDED